MGNLPWNERVNAISINPDMATRDDIARMATELSVHLNEPCTAYMIFYSDGRDAERKRITDALELLAPADGVYGDEGEELTDFLYYIDSVVSIVNDTALIDEEAKP